jgi:hypothetical protein
VLKNFRLDSQGVRKVLRSPEVRQMVDGVAVDVMSRVRAKVPQGVPVTVRTYTTDRGAASITVADIRAMSWQARDGILTRSAGEAGIEVKGETG